MKIFPTYEADETCGCFKLVDRAVLAVCSRKGQLLGEIYDLHVGLEKKDSRALEQ